MAKDYIEISVSGPNLRKDDAALLLIGAGSAGVVEGDMGSLTEGAGEVLRPRLTGYLPVDGAKVAALLRKFDSIGWSGEVADYKDRNWTKLWKRWIRPVRVGGVFLVRPTWLRGGNRDRGRKVIEIDPGMAFGTGSHPTTKLCLKALASLYKGRGYKEKAYKGRAGAPLKGLTVLDVGCGTGVLAIGAVKLGATRIVGIDTDPEALKVARRNVRSNGGGVVISPKALADIKGKFSVVVANIISGELIRLRDELIGRVATGGCLVLSGILAEEAGEVVGVFKEGGAVRHIKTHRGGEWAASVFIKAGVKAGKGKR